MIGPVNVGLGHTARVGKDTLAALITERNTHYRRAFADALKEEVGCMLLDLETNERNRQTAWQFVESRKHLPEMRLLLQAYGDGKREFAGRMYWIYQVLGYMEMFRAGELRVGATEHAGIVIPDCRYKNEVLTLLEHHFLLVDLWRTGASLEGSLARHRSETELSPLDFPFLLVNDGTPAEMLVLHDAIVRRWQQHGNPSRHLWPMVWARDNATYKEVMETLDALRRVRDDITRPAFLVAPPGPVL